MLRRIVAIVCASIFSGWALGAPTEGGVFVDALMHGQATGPVPKDQRFERAIQALKQSTGNGGDVVVAAWLVKRFTQQARCGRVAFALMQPSTKTVWPQVGGQLNVCDDGHPPLQVCGATSQPLVMPGTRCKDGQVAHDTAEVSTAIAEGMATGSLSERQARDKWNAGVQRGDGAPRMGEAGGK